MIMLGNKNHRISANVGVNSIVFKVLFPEWMTPINGPCYSRFKTHDNNQLFGLSNTLCLPTMLLPPKNEGFFVPMNHTL